MQAVFLNEVADSKPAMRWLFVFLSMYMPKLKGIFYKKFGN